MSRSSFSFAVVLALACGLANAQAYRWVDKDGKVRYSDVPPTGAKAKEIKPPASAPAAPAAAAKDGAAKDGKDAKEGQESADAKKGPLTPAEQERAYRDRQAKAKEAKEKEDKELALAEQRRQNCSMAQDSLRTLEAGRRIGSTNAKGETVYLDEAQIQERIAQARKVVADSCR
jgi:hypothetical protein